MSHLARIVASISSCRPALSAMFVVAVALLLAVPTLATAQEEVSRTVSAAANGRVSVEVLSGSVEISGWDQSEVEVTGTVGAGVEELVVTNDGDGVSISVEVGDKEGGYSERDAIDVQLKVRVPAGSSIDVESLSAGIRVAGVSGDVAAENVSGAISVQGSVASLSLSSVSGPVAFDGESSNTEVESVSGPVSLSGVSGNLDVEVVSGPIQVRATVIQVASIEVVSGGVDFSGSVASNGVLDIESHSGTARVALPAGQSGDFELSTFSGQIVNELGPAAEGGGGLGTTVEFSAGGGGADISVETFSGSIELVQN